MSLTTVTVPLNKSGTTVQPTANFGLRKCRRTDESKDQISKLPDDVLVSILSLLGLREAAKTSVLSNRWRYVWTSIPSLDFNDFFRLWAAKMNSINKSPLTLRHRLTYCVNTVLKSHQGPTIDQFIIAFDFGDKDSTNIDNWIKFALERQVKRLVLDFRCCDGQFSRGNYVLTTQFLRNYSLDSLKDLCLHSLVVTEEVLDYLLSHCPSLESLAMANPKSLVSLKVSGPSLRLKHLEIHTFSFFKSIEISDVDLVFFKYTGCANVHFKDVPHLAVLSLNGNCALFLLRNPWQFSTHLSKLETLILSLDFREDKCFPKFPELRNLRKLDLTLEAYWSINCLRGISLLTLLLEVSPLLHTLVLEFVGLREASTCLWRRLIDLNKAPKANCPHQCLKVFKRVGFVGCEVDIDVAKDILNVAVSLEKIIIDPFPSFEKELYDSRKPEEKLAARTRARQLETVLPSGARLVIL